MKLHTTRYIYRYNQRELASNGWPSGYIKRCSICRRSTNRVPYGVSVVRMKPVSFSGDSLHIPRHVCVNCAPEQIEKVRVEMKALHQQWMQHLRLLKEEMSRLKEDL